MKKQIIKILEKSGTTPAIIEPRMGIYIWRNDVFILKDGSDLEFDEIDVSEQKTVLSELKAGRYRLDNSFQG